MLKLQAATVGVKLEFTWVKDTTDKIVMIDKVRVQ
jgi:hypothetical protein